MIIILEGCDKSGKSTLKEKIKIYFEKKGINVDLIKCSAPKKNENLYNSYKRIIKNVSKNNVTIIDRFIWGELVYGPVYRGKSQLTNEMLTNLEKLILKYDPIIIYCEAPIDFIKKKFKEDNEKFTKIKDIKKIINLYHSVKKISILPIIEHKISIKEINPKNIFKLLKL